MGEPFFFLIEAAKAVGVTVDLLTLSRVTLDTAACIGVSVFIQNEGGVTLGGSLKFLLAPKYEDSDS